LRIDLDPVLLLPASFFGYKTFQDKFPRPLIRLLRALLPPMPGPLSGSCWGWGGLAQNQFSRASLGVLRPARALGLVGLVGMV